MSKMDKVKESRPENGAGTAPKEHGSLPWCLDFARRWMMMHVACCSFD